MTTVKCPKCGRDNSVNDNYCLNCGGSIANLTPPINAPLAPPTEQPPASFQSYGFNVPTHFQAEAATNSNLGSWVFFWYRIYTFIFAVAFLPWVVIGATALAGSSTLPTPEEQASAANASIILIIFGFGVFLPYIIGTFLPAKSFHWVYGIILILMSMTTCVAFPLALPLFIYWIRPETKAFFGRKF